MDNNNFSSYSHCHIEAQNSGWMIPIIKSSTIKFETISTHMEKSRKEIYIKEMLGTYLANFDSITSCWLTSQNASNTIYLWTLKTFSTSVLQLKTSKDHAMWNWNFKSIADWKFLVTMLGYLSSPKSIWTVSRRQCQQQIQKWQELPLPFPCIFCICLHVQDFFE